MLAADRRAAAAARHAEAEAEGAIDDGERSLPVKFGPYELLERLDEGSSGIVFRARQSGLGRMVAIKVLRAGRLATPSEVARFHAEASAAAKLDHPSVVPVLESGTVDGRHYIAMKLIEGTSLARAMDRLHGDDRRAASLVERVALAADHAHRHGVLHRDLKPSNILLARDGTPYLTDFGTAMLLHEPAAATRTGTIVGTPGYMAPEQVTHDGAVTVATDVYALGGVLYELLVGRPPNLGDGVADTLARIATNDPRPVRSLCPAVDRNLATICQVCLARDPARRYATAAALAGDLRRWLEHRPIVARKARGFERVALWVRRRPVVAALEAAVAALLLCIAVLGAVAGVELRRQVDALREAEVASRELLRESYLSEARSLRSDRRAGRARLGLERLTRAAAIRTGLDVVSEGAALLALPDLVIDRSWPRQRRTAGDVRLDGTFERYVTLTPDGSCELRSASNHALLQRLTNAGPRVRDAVFSEDGRLVALRRIGDGWEEGRFEVWDLDTGNLAYATDGLPSISRPCFVPDRRAILVADSDQPLVELDLDSGQHAPVAPSRPGSSYRAVAFDPTGRFVAATTSTSTVLVVDCSTGQVRELEEARAECHAVDWSPDGCFVSAACADGNVFVWEAAKGSLVHVLSGHLVDVVRVHFLSRDLLLTYSWDETTRLWNVDTGEELLCSEERLGSVSASGEHVAVHTAEQVHLRSLRRGDALDVLHGHSGRDPRCLSVSQDGRYAVSGGADGVVLWDLATCAQLDAWGSEEVGPVNGLVFSGAGALWVGADEGLFRWSVRGGSLGASATPIRHGKCFGIDLAAGGSTLVAQFDDRIDTLDAGSGVPQRSVSPPAGAERVRIDRAADWVVAGAWRGRGIHAWRALEAEPSVVIEEDQRFAVPAFAPNGRALVAAVEDAFAIYDIPAWQERWRRPRSKATRADPVCVGVSPCGGLIAVPLGASTIGLLSAADGTTVLELEGRRHFTPTAVCFTPDGRVLLVGTNDNRILVWRLDRLRAALRAHGLSDPMARNRPILSGGSAR